MLFLPHLLVCLAARLFKKLCINCHEMFPKGSSWNKEQSACMVSCGVSLQSLGGLWFIFVFKINFCHININCLFYMKPVFD